jgi:hypothetical protein
VVLLLLCFVVPNTSLYNFFSSFSGMHAHISNYARMYAVIVDVTSRFFLSMWSVSRTEVVVVVAFDISIRLDILYASGSR